MLPLQPARLYDYQQPTAESHRQGISRVERATQDQFTSSTSEASEERRQLADRRAIERREKQQAIFLNTRKNQGRRRSAGRRLSDNYSPYRPISLQG